MSKRIGRIILSVLVVATTVISVAVDWNSSHVFNPDWYPHARFHDVMLLWLLIGLVPILLWLLWRNSLEPEVGVTVTTLVILFFWSSFFVNLLVPGTSPAANLEESPPILYGIPLYPNMIIAAISIVLAIIGYWLYRSGSASVRD